jgi:hypothetical protein
MSDYAKFTVEEDDVVSAWVQSSPHGAWVLCTPKDSVKWEIGASGGLVLAPVEECVIYPGDDWLDGGEGWDWPITYSDGTQLHPEAYSPEQRARGLSARPWDWPD